MTDRAKAAAERLEREFGWLETTTKYAENIIRAAYAQGPAVGAEQLLEKIHKAMDMVHALCQPRGTEGHRDWIMSIPAQPNYDPDIVIADALREAEAYARQAPQPTPGVAPAQWEKPQEWTFAAQPTAEGPKNNPVNTLSAEEFWSEFRKSIDGPFATWNPPYCVFSFATAYANRLAASPSGAPPQDNIDKWADLCSAIGLDPWDASAEQIVELLRKKASSAEARPRCPKCKQQPWRLSTGMYEGRLHVVCHNSNCLTRFPITSFIDFAQFFPAPAEAVRRFTKQPSTH